jgi:hypothetical protein
MGPSYSFLQFGPLALVAQFEFSVEIPMPAQASPASWPISAHHTLLPLSAWNSRTGASGLPTCVAFRPSRGLAAFLLPQAEGQLSASRPSTAAACSPSLRSTPSPPVAKMNQCRCPFHLPDSLLPLPIFSPTRNGCAIGAPLSHRRLFSPPPALFHPRPNKMLLDLPRVSPRSLLTLPFLRHRDTELQAQPLCFSVTELPLSLPRPPKLSVRTAATLPPFFCGRDEFLHMDSAARLSSGGLLPLRCCESTVDRHSAVVHGA